MTTTTTLTTQMEAPFRQEVSGAIRVGQSRVLLELVIEAFQDGAAPEEIVYRYDTLDLADVYAVIAFYLQHRDRVEAYMAEREVRAKEVRQRIEARQKDMSEIRARILARQKP